MQIKQTHNNVINYLIEQAKLSKCKDKKTAAIIVSADMQQIFSIGINGGPRGLDNCLCNEKMVHKLLPNGDSVLVQPKYTCVHAEMNALIKVNRPTDQTIPLILICTKQPCHMCATMMINSRLNITEVWYIEDYWDTTGIDILKKHPTNKNGTGFVCVKKLKEYEQGKWCFND